MSRQSLDIYYCKYGIHKIVLLKRILQNTDQILINKNSSKIKLDKNQNSSKSEKKKIEDKKIKQKNKDLTHSLYFKTISAIRENNWSDKSSSKHRPAENKKSK